MRRVISLWLPRLATDRIGKRRPETRARPLVAAAAMRGRLTVTAVNAPAEEAGLAPGLALADARALCPGLAVAAADPAGDAKALADLAAWCGRYTPWTAVDASGHAGGADGIWLDITGCAHLFGGEEALLADLVRRLAGFGFAARAAAAPTPGAAWAWARFGPGAAPVLAPGEIRARLADLPMAALRLAPALVDSLDRLGLRRVGDLYRLPRAGLAARFGDVLLRRLDQALGAVFEPLSPRRPRARHLARLAFPEPVAEAEAIAAGLDRLLDTLCRRLAREDLGARRLEFTLARADGTAARAAIGTSRPSRAPRHLARLFAPRLEGLDPGPGVETLVLAAPVTEPLAASQGVLAGERGQLRGDAAGERTTALGALIDRLANRLGGDNVRRFAPRESHVPERAAIALAAWAEAPRAGAAWPRARRPLRLLSRPEPVEATAPIPDYPPLQFRRRGVVHRIARAEGPERIAPEWWRAAGAGLIVRAGLKPAPTDPGAGAPSRDYYVVEDTEGRRYWLYREGVHGSGARPRWYLHGVFA